jgi:hypothetical protein
MIIPVTQWMQRAALMTKPEVWLRNAERLMARHRTCYLAVVRRGKLVGLVVDRGLGHDAPDGCDPLCVDELRCRWEASAVRRERT